MRRVRFVEEVWNIIIVQFHLIQKMKIRGEIDDEYQNWDDIETDDSDSGSVYSHEFYDEVDWLDCIRYERTVTSQETNAAYRLSP